VFTTAGCPETKCAQIVTLLPRERVTRRVDDERIIL